MAVRAAQACTAGIVAALAVTVLPGRPSAATVDPGADVAAAANGLLAYVQDDGNIYTVRPDGTGRRQLTFGSAVDELGPAWSPDGRRIAYTRRTGSGSTERLQVWVMNADGSGQRRLVTPAAGGNDGAPTWSPDGSRVAFVRDFESGGDACLQRLHVADVRTGMATRLSNDDCVSSPSWSPDGTLIAYNKIVYGRTVFGDYSVRTVSMASREVRTLTTRRYPADPDWSPAGRYLVIDAQTGPNGELANSNIVRIFADGSGRRPLTEFPGCYCETNFAAGPAYSSDGRFVVYTYVDKDHLTSRVAIISATGGPQRLLPGQGRSPDWQPVPS